MNSAQPQPVFTIVPPYDSSFSTPYIPPSAPFSLDLSTAHVPSSSHTSTTNAPPILAPEEKIRQSKLNYYKKNSSKINKNSTEIKFRKTHEAKTLEELDKDIQRYEKNLSMLREIRASKVR